MGNFNGLVKATLPVILGVLAAGFIMNKFYDIELIEACSDGFDM